MNHDSVRSKPRLHWYDALAMGALVAALLARGPAGSAADTPKIVVVFVLMVAFIRHRLPVGLVILLCAPVLGRLFGVPWSRIASVMTFGVFDSGAEGLHAAGLNAVGLGLAVFTVTTLGILLVESRTIRGMLLALEHLLRDVRWIAAVAPAMIGLLPMPGGALLSAPIVAELSERLEIDAETKSLANYWFRHVWEYCWFLYPGLLYVGTLFSDRSLPMLLLAHAPLTIGAIAIGVVVILLPIPKSSHAAPSVTRKARAVFSALWPIAAIVLSLSAVTPIKSLLPLRVYLMALVTAVVIIVFSVSQRLALRMVFASARRAVSLRLVFLVAGVYILKAMFEISGAANFLPAQLEYLHIPDALILFCVPLIVGLLTGYTIAAIATTFPLLLPIIDNSTAGIMLAYAGGFLGVLLSPVHLCLVLTRDYFDASWSRTYRRLIPCVAVLVALAFILYFLYR